MSFAGILYWHWWVAGLSLLIVETFLPGAIFLWLGISAILVGGLVLIAPGIDWQVQFVLFSVLSVAAIVLWRRYHPARQETDAEVPALNRRGESYVGRVFTLDQPIVNGTGKLRVDDSQWRIVGTDVPAGAKVRVVQADGANLHVERTD
jgi:inner membrane protein